MKIGRGAFPYLTLLLALLANSASALPVATYFDTGLSPDGGYPSIWGDQTGNFTPAHNMFINQASSYNIPNSGAAGYIASIEFYLNGTLIEKGVGNGFVNGQPTPAMFSQPVFLTAGVTYGIDVDTSGYLDLFHSSQISTPDAMISNISAIDANHNQWVAFPSLTLVGPVPEPSTVSLLLLGGVGLAIARRRRISRN